MIRALVVFDDISKGLKPATPELEKIVADDAIAAVFYAREVLKAPFTLAETLIATDSHASVLYARDVIKGRWLPGEAVIKGTVWEELYDAICAGLPAPEKFETI